MLWKKFVGEFVGEFVGRLEDFRNALEKFGESLEDW